MAANSTTIIVSIYIYSVINVILWLMPHRTIGNINWESTDSEDV